jgi:hypothetical protein
MDFDFINQIIQASLIPLVQGVLNFVIPYALALVLVIVLIHLIFPVGGEK